MITTVEISMYPFRENYRDLIQDFARKLNEYSEIEVTTGPTSTVMVGEYPRLMECLNEMLRWSYAEHGRAVFVAKFLLDYNPAL
jgi:uncharacterized protein YqgV (UPF0045/DUF77 family)